MFPVKLILPPRLALADVKFTKFPTAVLLPLSETHTRFVPADVPKQFASVTVDARGVTSNIVSP